MAPTTRRIHGLQWVYSLFDVGRLSRRILPLREPPLSVLLTGDLGTHRTRAHAATGIAVVVAVVHAVFSCIPHPVGTGELQAHLLLLQGGVLQGLLAGAAILLSRDTR